MVTTTKVIRMEAQMGKDSATRDSEHEKTVNHPGYLSANNALLRRKSHSQEHLRVDPYF